VLGIPARLAQETVRTFKELRRKQAREREMAKRVSVTVHFKDVVWVEDGGQFGRIEGEPLRARERMERGSTDRADLPAEPGSRKRTRSSVQAGAGSEAPGSQILTAEVLRDPATTKTLAVGAGPPATGEDLTALLDYVKSERGTMPLVLCVDNGAAQKSMEVAAYCELEKVIMLRNLLRTPRHNPFAERTIGELKQESGLTADTPLKDEAEGIERLQAAWRRLDNRHHRPRHGYRTAADVDATMPRWYPVVDRARFYEAARRAIEEAVRVRSRPRARRLAEREAIFRTLEDFGLVSRTRGGKPLPRPEAARLS